MTHCISSSSVQQADDLVVAIFTCLYALLFLVTCSGIFIIIETINLVVKYIYIKIDIVLDDRGNALSTPPNISYLSNKV
jgi:hypothetical protein